MYGCLYWYWYVMYDTLVIPLFIWGVLVPFSRVARTCSFILIVYNCSR